MKNTLVIGLVLMLTGISFGYSGGNGEPETPYEINNVSDLLQLAGEPNDYNKCFIMTADINLAGYDFNNALIAPYYATFTGTFDGSGHKISNLKIIADSNETQYLGLFGNIDLEGEINNLGLENVYVEGRHGIYGGLAATNNGTIINCYSDGTIIRKWVPSYVGGLVGLNGGNIINCHTGGQIISNIISNGGFYYETGVGGLAGGSYGHSSTSRITNCYSSVNISNTVEPKDCLEGTGGLVGQGGSNIIRNCFSTGLVYGFDNVGGLVGRGSDIEKCYFTGDINGRNAVGGLAGAQATIKKSFSIGDVNGESGVGGLVGGYGNVENSYSTGNVRGSSYVGGLGGSGVEATNCYSTGIVTGTSYIGGLIGAYGSAVNSYFLNTSGPDNGTGTPLTDSEMNQCFNFNTWDFGWNWPSACELGPEYIWWIWNGVTYPDLAWHAGICTVPNVVGLHIYDVNAQIIDRGFTVGTISYEHSDTVTGSYIISQSPEPNTQPDCGSAVNYTVSMGPWPCQIPNIVGKTMSVANNYIIFYKHTVGDISYAYSDTVAAGKVISQDPAPCSPQCAECGLAINYVASLGQLPDNGKFPDYYDDDIVNFKDFAIFANAWLTTNSFIDLTGDNYINIVDLKVFCNHWLKEE